MGLNFYIKARRFISRPLVFSIVAALIFFASAELACRVVLIDHTSGEDYWSRNDPHIFRVDPLLGWSLRPNISEHHIQCGVIETNSLGVRHEDIVLEKPEGEFRAVSLGDSATFALEVTDFDNLYTTRLQNRLRDYFGTESVQVINGAVPGYTSYQGFLALRDVLMRYEPDLVTVYMGNNDTYGEFQTPADVASDSTVMNLKRFMYRSYLVAVLRKAMLSLDLIHDSIPAHQPGPSIRNFEHNLLAIQELCDSRGAELILFTVPVNLQYRFTGDSCRDCTDRQQELYDSGLEAFDAEDYDTAKSDLGSLLAERPDVYLANFCLGEIAFSRGRYGTALEFYQRAVDLAPAGQVSSAYNDCIMGVGDRTDAQVVDLRGEFEKAHILSGVSSYEYFADHIHCNDRGHRLISELLFEFISADYADSLSD